MSNNILNAALEYLEMGLSIIPIRPKDKRPLVPWEQYQERLATSEEMESWFDKWPDANIAMVTGKLSNVVAIDADSPGRVRWLQETFPTSVNQVTGNGIHGFFRPGNTPVKTQVGVLDKVDVRGDGGYVVIAPSIHSTGRIYTLQYAEGFDAWDDLADFPYNIFPSEKTADTKAPVTRKPAAQGERNATLTRLAGRYCKAGLDYDQVLVLCANDNKTYSPPLSGRDVETICRSIYGKDQRTQIEVLTSEDITSDNISLQIPDEILHPGGLVELGITGLQKRNCPDIPQFLFPVVLTHIANAIAGKIRFNDLWPNLFCIKVGRTSSGKSDSDKIFNRAIKNLSEMEGFYGATGIVSGPGLLRGLVSNPQCLLVLDEATSLFKRYDKGNAITDGITKALLEVFSGSGGDIYLPYSNEKNVVNIADSCVSLIGNATPLIFDAITQDDFRSGTMQRFDFFTYDGEIKDRGVVDHDNPELAAFCDGLQQIYVSAAPQDGTIAGLLDVFNVARNSECNDRLQDFSREIIQRQRDADRQGADEGNLGIISRGYDLAIKYALVHMATNNGPEGIYAPMGVDNLEYGIKVSDMLAAWKLNVLGGQVTTGDFHRDCEVFKDAIKAAVKAGRKNPSFAVLANRKPGLKNWAPEYSAKIISVLDKRGEMVTSEVRNKTCYYLPKKRIQTLV